MTAEAAPRTAEIARWKRRTRLVAFFRKALPLSILAILIFLGGWIVARSLVPSLAGAAVEISAIRMINPRFYGRDSRDRAFLLGAKEAVRSVSDKGQITLIEPVFSLGAGKVTADRGLYRQGATNLILRGNVLLISDRGERMQTQEALINTRTGVITNSAARQAGVQIDSGFGNMRAEHYSVGRDGTVILKGNVHGTFKPR